MKKVMMITYGGGHVNLLIPVIRELQKNPEIKFCILGLSVSGDILRSQNIPFKTYTDYKDLIFDAEAEKYGRELANLWHVDGKGISYDDSMIYLGCSMRDLVHDNGEARAREILKEKSRAGFLQVDTMRKIIEFEKPDIVITGNVPRSERAATLAAKKMGIPTLNCSDYFEYENRQPLEADKIAVMCDITRDNLLKKGVAPERIVITGQPAFDSIPKCNAGLSRADICKKVGLPPEKTYIVLGTQPIPTCERMLRSTIDAVKKIPNLTLIVKPHPGEDQRFHQSVLAESGVDHYLITAPVIRDLIQISEALITFFSTIAFETVLLGKPLLTVNLTGEPDPIPLANFGVGLGVYSEEALLPAIKRILEDKPLAESFRAARTKHFSEILDGKGAQRVATLVLQMLKLK